MTWTPPTLVVRVALALGPNDTPSGGDWTDLSSRVKGAPVRCKRGRNDVLSQFQPGTITIPLDNTDRMLDPMNPDGLVYIGDGLGLPKCPVEIDWSWEGNTYTAFRGFLGPDCWPTTTSPRGGRSTVDVQVIDAAGYSPDLPSDAWGAFTQAERPDWWLRMDLGFPVLSDSSVIPNRSGSGGSAGFTSPSGISRMVTGSFSASPAVRVVPGNYFTSTAANVMPDGDESDLTIWCLWTGVTPLASSEEAVVLRLVSPGGSTKRFDVVVRDDGEAEVNAYDSGGTSIASAIIDRTGSVISRFDDNSPHLLIVRFDGGDLDVWFGGCGLTGGTLTATTDVYESDLICGPADVDCVIDEVTVWRKALSDGLIAGAILATGGQAQPWHGDTWLDRIGHLYDAAGWPIGFDETDEWHMPTADPDDGLFGIGALSNLPANLGQAIQTVASWAGGAAWVTKDGYWRARSLQALTDPFYAAHYATVSAEFTDDDTEPLPSGKLRHAGVEPSGISVDRIINRVEASFYVRNNPPTDVTPRPFVIAPADDASVARYGHRDDTFQSEWWGWEANSTVMDTRRERFKEPTAGIDTVHLDCGGNPDLTLWLISVAELELAVDVTYTPFGEDPVTFEGLNIQAIDWTLTGETLTADLTVARS